MPPFSFASGFFLLPFCSLASSSTSSCQHLYIIIGLCKDPEHAINQSIMASVCLTKSIAQSDSNPSVTLNPPGLQQTPKTTKPTGDPNGFDLLAGDPTATTAHRSPLAFTSASRTGRNTHDVLKRGTEMDWLLDWFYSAYWNIVGHHFRAVV